MGTVPMIEMSTLGAYIRVSEEGGGMKGKKSKVKKREEKRSQGPYL
jgi:hypothetical protein